MSELTEKRPAPFSGWREFRVPPEFWEKQTRNSLRVSGWSLGPLRVFSELALAQSPKDGSVDVVQWHISITWKRKRPEAVHVRKVLRAFGMKGAEEDNHYPGIARYFWLAVDPAHRTDCECKETETTVVDADGFHWQNPKDENECRGCEYQRTFGKPCPLHAAGVQP
jgi:hypothetical protein